MENKAAKHIWHVGNWCVHTGQKYIESPFLSATKGVEIVNYAQPLMDALAKIPGVEVKSEPSWNLYNMSPEKFEEQLQWADVVIFGDVETKCMMLHPDFFNRSKWGGAYVTFPDRFLILKEWVAKGGHFHMNGGWYSFSGEIGKGGWGRSLFHEVLPVVCLQHDDLIESTASFPVRATAPDHPFIRGIDLSNVPPILGFNETSLREGCRSILEIQSLGDPSQEKWYPLLAEREYGKGKATVFTTGASPHWGINLVKWDQYNQLWKNIFMG